jgi:glycosyltransferase involved in cell wall biosynthesis
LAQAVVDLVEQREQWETLKANGRSFIEQERTWSASVARYASIYRELAPQS